MEEKPNQTGQKEDVQPCPEEVLLEPEELAQFPAGAMGSMLSSGLTEEEIRSLAERAAKPYDVPPSPPAELFSENDRSLPRRKRIIAFLERRQAYDPINLSDFLKSLYPIVKPPQKPGWMDQGNMRNLKQELVQMQERGEIVFSNNNHTRLGDNQHDKEGKRFHLHLGDLKVEARLP